MPPRAVNKGFKIFTLRIEGVNADNIPLEDVGAYLLNLSAIIGKEYSPRLHKITKGSLDLATKVPEKDEICVRTRLALVKSSDAPQDLITSQRKISELLGYHKARKATLLDPSNKKVLEFPVIRPLADSSNIPKIPATSALQGKVIRIGGKNDDVTVDIEDVDGHVYNCRAKREIASKLAKEMFYPTVRVLGTGYWVRKDTGWDIEGFKIYDFELLDDDSLEVAIAKIRETIEILNDIEDPFSVLDGIRSGAFQ